MATDRPAASARRTAALIRAVRLACVTLLALMTAGCFTSAPALQPPPTSTAPDTPTAPSVIAVPTSAPAVNPLTGLPVSDPNVLNRRPLVVKISNAPPLVRPQAGIGAADMVFEHYAEGGLTRFSAVFYSQAPARVGSIRSARLIDDTLVPMFQGLLGYSGASDGVQAIINAGDYFERTYKGVLYALPYFWRDETLDAPHNLFMNADAVFSLAAQEGFAQRPDLRGLIFSPAPPAGATGPAQVVDLHYRATQVGWLYVAGRGQYLRFSDGLPHTDANIGAQVAADNVVILYAAHRETDIVESEWQGVISYSIEIQLWGEGDALILRDGQQYAARWLRPERTRMIQLVSPEGELLALRPGVTWFQLLPPPGGEERLVIG